jgi:hypothetical protein
VYAADHTVPLDTGMGALLATETSEMGGYVSGEKHPLCPWAATGQGNGTQNFEGRVATLDDWHTFRVAFDEGTQPQRVTLTIDSYTEYVEDVWYEPGSCTAASGHPGAVCSHDGHRVTLTFGADGGSYSAAGSSGALAATNYFTAISGGNTSGTGTQNTFNGAYGVASLSDGRIVVTNVLNLSVGVFDPANGYYRDWTAVWTVGTATYPYGVAVVDDVIYVALQDGKIRVYSATGVYQSTITTLTSGRRMAAGPDGYLYVAQADGLNRVAVMSTAGTVIRYLGSSGTGNGQFGTQGPGGIGFDAEGNAYVADTTGKRVNVYDASGAYVTHWGTAGSGAGQFDAPRGLAVRDGTVFVVNLNTTTNGLSALQMFDLDGTYQQQWVGSTTGTLGVAPTGTTKFDYPTSVHVAGGLIYVTDGYGGIAETGRNEVRVFEAAATGGPLGQVRTVAVGYVDGVKTCVRNPEYVAGETGGVSPWA